MYLKHPNVLFDKPTFLKLREKLVRIDLAIMKWIKIKIILVMHIIFQKTIKSII